MIFLKKLILLFSKDALNWSKVTIKGIYNIKKISIQINNVLLNFLFVKESWKIYQFSQKY